MPSRQRAHWSAAPTIPAAPVSFSSVVYQTNGCACISTSAVACHDEDGDLVCARCGRQSAPQAIWPALAAPGRVAASVVVD